MPRAARSIAHITNIEPAAGNTAFSQGLVAGSALKLRVRMTSFDAICQVFEHGVGIAVVPERAARSYRRSGITIISLTDEWAIRRLLLCVREFNQLSVHAKRLVEHLRAK